MHRDRRQADSASAGWMLTNSFCSVPFFWKRTWPATLANSVWSVPMPTFAPGCTCVPRWRTMMFPASTCSPPKRFTPSRLEWESRPFLVLPPAFLCAMTVLSCEPNAQLARADLGDFDFCELLPMGFLSQIMLATAELHDRHLRALTVTHDGREDLATGQKRLAELHIGALPDEQDFREFHG